MDLLAGARVVDLIFCVVVLEAFALFLLQRHTGKGLASIDVALMLTPGLLLLAALRAELLQSSSTWTVLFLGSAFPAHLVIYATDGARHVRCHSAANAAWQRPRCSTQPGGPEN
jgi:hypothetical protein